MAAANTGSKGGVNTPRKFNSAAANSGSKGGDIAPRK